MVGLSLTPRERAVLAAVERRLNNPEIAAELFISVRTVESHIASLRRKLDAGSRAALVRAGHDLRDTSVRVPPDLLRGRGRDLAAVGALLDARNEVTVVGPGGVGKTRLALEVASGRSAEVPLVVELEHAVPDDVATRIARALGIEASGRGDELDAAAVALATHDYLLVLDNADRVGPATADVLARLRTAAPRLRVLVTSRTPLGAPGETVHPLDPLETGGVDAPASTLLDDRLRTGGVHVHPVDQPLVDSLAVRLDGLPLALELAASVARHLPLRELDARLARDHAALDRATPAGRHRTLETAFDWTWDLLAADEQDALRRLAALPRTFDVDLAEAVVGPGAAGAVMRLLDRSLIVPARAHPGRFRLLAVMREFVHARTDPALIREVQERHALHITAVSVGFVAIARTDASPQASRTARALCPEANAALRWMLSAGHPRAVELAAALAVAMEQYGADIDGMGALAEAARDDRVLTTATPQDLLVIGMALAFADVDLVHGLADRALERATGDDETRAAEQLAGVALAYRADVPGALQHLAEAERLARRLGEDWELGAIRQARGIALRSAPDSAAALDALASSMRAYARAGDLVHVNNARYMMASVAADRPDDRERAVRWAVEAREAAEAMRNEHEAAHARVVQATLGLAEAGDLADLTETFRHFGDLRCVHRTLMLRASRATRPADRIALLEAALAATAAAGDATREAAALEQLANAHHAASDTPAALAALDRLAALVGPAHARAVCPAALRDRFDADADAPAPV